MSYDIIASIVLYKNNVKILTKTINSFLKTELNVKLILVDNSPTDILKKLANNKNIEYIYNNRNLGFGKAHNIAIKKSIEITKYFIVLNPDIYFEKGNIEILFHFMNNNIDIGQIMPKILYPNGDMQYLCKKNPTFLDLFIRRFLHYLNHIQQYYL